MTMNEWRNQGWTFTIGLPFAWIAGLIEPEPTTDDKKSDQPADADH